MKIIGYNNFGTLDTILFPNADFTLKQTARNGGYAAWYSYGSITLNKNDSLSIINDYTSNYNIYFSNNSSFILNNPKKVILYNEKANVIYTPSAILFDFSFSRVNLFTSIINRKEAITNETLPTYAWYKETGTFNMVGAFSNTSVKINSNNYIEEELVNLPDINNFIFANKKIFSVGDFFFRIDAITDTDTTMSGATLPLASILISYQDINTVVNAGDSGSFTYSYPIGTVITFQVKEQNSLLYHTKVIQIVYSGELPLESASKIVNISLNPILCPRSSELVVNVMDSRVINTDWKFYAAIKHDLTSPQEVTLKDSLVYKDDTGKITVLSSTPTLAYTGKKNDESTLNTSVTWKDDEGILLMITDKLINGMEYETNIIWTVEE